VWDPAIIAVYSELKANNEAYVAAVGQLDLTAQPLYLPDSFRDAATIQKILGQLHERLAVADQFASLDPIVAKTPGYVAAVRASENEKRQFLAGFMPTLQQSVDNRKRASALEHEWLRASIALYEFMLANQDGYSISADGKKGTFLKAEVSKQFQSKMQEVQSLKRQFLEANGAYLRSQSAARAQAGMTE
jgi:hypothetical protein